MFVEMNAEAKSIKFVSVADLETELQNNSRLQNFALQKNFEIKPGKFLFHFDEELELKEVFVVQKDFSLSEPKAFLELGGELAKTLGKDCFQVEGLEGAEFKQFALGWALAQYDFDAFKSQTKEKYVAELVCEDHYDELSNLVDSSFLVRDLVNTPANHMNPEHMQKVFEEMAEEFSADLTTVVGEDLLAKNFPAVFAVGMGSNVQPRIMDLKWGKKGAPKLTLVGKGVCFDSGGYDLKPSAGMRIMKKDMGGAAHAIALARAIMKADLEVELRLIVPAVENMVDGKALKPGDIMETRKGLRIEIDNTDAEGRLVLCDALSLACEEKPDLLIDFATLTGAARVALGQELPALFSNRDEMARALQDVSFKLADPVWHMPLYKPYAAQLGSTIGDYQNCGTGFGGSITAALYLSGFVPEETPWMHLDVYAWSQENRSYGPKGGEAYSLRSVFQFVKDRLKI